MKIRKFIAIFLLICLVLPTASACGKTGDDGRLKVVCTIFPYYDWSKNIVGDAEGVELSLLVKNGADLHSYNAGVADIVAISSCDVLIMTGGESDAWVEAALAQAQNENITVIRLLDILEAEGRALHAEEDHGHDESCEHVLDEHIWLSPKNAVLLCERISEALSSVDTDNKELYSSNSETYISRLAELDASYEAAAEDMWDKPLLFADRFPFRYLVEAYGLEYFAAFPSCSSDSEASFETITTLADVIDRYGLEYVIVTESSSEDVARSMISASERKDCEIIALDSMQSTTQKDAENGADYVDIMQKNLLFLKEK